VAINDTVIDTKWINVKNGKVTVDKEALAGYANGSYKVTVGFNDSLLTTVKDMVTLQIKNSTATGTGDSDSTTEPEDNTTNETDDTADDEAI
jgi:hypothetical protein